MTDFGVPEARVPYSQLGSRNSIKPEVAIQKPEVGWKSEVGTPSPSPFVGRPKEGALAKGPQPRARQWAAGRAPGWWVLRWPGRRKSRSGSQIPEFGSLKWEAHGRKPPRPRKAPGAVWWDPAPMRQPKVAARPPLAGAGPEVGSLDPEA
jgi:hypothetical protein